jgi:hypothetical protein
MMLDQETVHEDLPLFDKLRICDRCFDLGVWQLPNGQISTCPNIQMSYPHNQANPAGQILLRALKRLGELNIAVNPFLFNIARLLTNFTTTEPCSRDLILDPHFRFSPSSLRKFHETIEELRRVWLLPVGSRKSTPAGYWIITDVADFAEWVERSKAAPITQLSTIHKVAKRNIPIFAEQLELDFWRDMQPEEIDAAA